MKTYLLELENMEFHANHGCVDTERVSGNEFTVDFRGTLPYTFSDNLEDTVNYSGIYDIVKAQMAVPSNLLEHVAGRIADAINSEYPQFLDFTLRVSKRRPPVAGVCGWSRVTLSKRG